MTTPDATEPDVPRPAFRWVEHLGTGLTIGYLTLIAVGMFHSVLGYRRFGINILEYTEPGDFLLAPFQDPMVLLVTVLPLALAWGYMTVVERVSERTRTRRRAEGKPLAWWESSDETLTKLKPYGNLMKYGLGLFWLGVSANLYQTIKARRVIRGEGTRVAITYTDGTVERGTPTRPLSLVGSTSRFFFLFRTETWEVEVIPAENVLRLMPEGALPKDMQQRRERTWRRLDSLAARSAR